MEDWSKGLIEGLETAVMEVEKFLIEVGEDFNKVVDEMTKSSEHFTQEITKSLEDLEEYLDEIVEPIIEIFLDWDLDLDETPTQEENFPDSSFVTYIHPSKTEYTACQGCCHYHGHVYSGNILVCAMHPFGVETDTCPDWES